jgi:hypothetical protein
MKTTQKKSDSLNKSELMRLLSGKYEWKPGDLKKKSATEREKGKT